MILWDYNEKENKKTLDILRSLGYFKAHVFTVDVFNEAQLRSISRQIKDKFGEISMIIMAAAPRIAPKSVLELDYKNEIEKQFLVGYMAQLWLIQEFLQNMIAKKHGHFVTISNSSVIFDVPLISVFASIRLAFGKLFDTLKKELKAYKFKNVHTSTVYMTLLKGDLAISESCDASLEFSDLPFIRHESVEVAAKQIISNILKNKSIIFIPGIMRLLFSIKYLVSPKIFVFFIYRKLFKSNNRHYYDYDRNNNCFNFKAN